jgi:hypothetical protein
VEQIKSRYSALNERADIVFSEKGNLVNEKLQEIMEWN